MPKIHITDLLIKDTLNVPLSNKKNIAKYYNSSVINGLEIFCLNSNLYSN